MHSIFTIFKKELRRSFTDIRVLCGMILPGLIIFIMYTFIGSVASNAEQKQTKYTEFIVRVVNCPEDDAFENIFTSFGYKTNDLYENETPVSKEAFLEKIADKEADLYVYYPENFIEMVDEHKADGEKPTPNVEIYYNSSKEESAFIFEVYSTYLNNYEATKCNMFDINNPESGTDYNLVKKDDISKKLLSTMLPYLFMIIIFSSALSFCADSFAGEKERGTMATLLMTPTKRSQIAIGKILALSVMALVSATSSFLGIMLSLPKLMGSASDQFSFNVYGVGTYILLFFVMISVTLLFIALLAVISAFSKSVKEASSMSLPLMIIVVLIGISGLTSNGAVSSPALYLIPIYNAVQTLIGLLSGTMNTVCLLVEILSNLFYVCIIVFVLTKMLNSEKIMFKK